MLVLSRREEESIHIGSEIEITILSVANGRVKLGIRAPNDVRVLRSELEIKKVPRSRRTGDDTSPLHAVERNAAADRVTRPSARVRKPSLACR